MLSKTVFAFAGLLAAAQAILVSSPAKDSKVDFSKSVDIIWTSVSTDPSTFNLVLVDQTNMVPIPIQDKVKTSDNKFTLTNFVATPGSAYKFNFLSDDPLNTGILAQSQTFQIIKSGGTPTDDSSSSSSSTTTTDSSSSTGTGAATGGSDSSSTSTSDSTTLSTSKTTAGTPSKTGSASSSQTANASSTGAAATQSTNAAVALGGKTFGVAGGIFAGLLMLL